MATTSGKGTQQGQQQPKVTPAAGASVKEDFGSTELAVQAETNSAALAARSQAMVQAAFVMAERHPRDWDEVRVKLLRECQRPGFARAARYAKPMGGNNKVEGPSIRFAEAALRTMRNVVVDTSIIRDDTTRRTIEVVILDAEANVRFTRQVSIDKTVERSYVKEGQMVLSERRNTHGKQVFIIGASEDELANKQAAAVSKALRTEGLRLLPGDILEECMAQCVATQRDADAADPDKARKDVCDAFAELNVTPAMLKAYLGHDVGTCSPAEWAELRAIYAAIRDGETTWGAVMEDKGGTPGGVTAPPQPAATQAPQRPAQPAAATAAPVSEPAPAQQQVAAPPQPVAQPAPPPQAETKPEAPPPPPQAQEVQPAAAPPTTAAAPEPPAQETPSGESLPPAEQALAEGLAKATSKKEVLGLMKQVTALPKDRQPYWRQKFNERMGQVPK